MPVILAGLNWNDIDVLIMPDGKYRFLSDKNYAEQFELWIQKWRPCCGTGNCR